MYEEISKEEAKELVDEASRGILVVINPEPVPVIGDVPPEDHQIAVKTEGYRFGAPELEGEEADD